VYHLLTNKKYLGYFQKILLWRHFRLPRIPHFVNLCVMHFLGKVSCTKASYLKN